MLKSLKNSEREKKMKNNRLLLIPKAERYIQYIIEVIIKIPRTEKFNIGTEYKQSMYNMLRKILYLNKMKEKDCIETLNEIDVELNIQRIYARIMKNNKWIDERKFNIIMEQIYEIGKILGGLLKHYGKMDKK